MLTTLIRRELLDNLMTFRFAATVLIMLLLVVANTAVLISHYEQRLVNYNDAVKRHQRQLQEKITYSAGDVYVDRPPNPLSIFNAGFDKRLGSLVPISYGSVPSLWDSYIRESDNPFMGMFASMDIVFVFEITVSLLALIFAYDALTGEYERGTLRLVLTHPVRRGHILLAKYISAMLCLLVPLLMSLLLAVILLTTSTAIFLSTDDFLRIGGIVFTSILYLSVFYLIGFLISAAARRTSTALMFSMFIWGFLVLIYPNVILAIIPRPEAPQARKASAFNQIEQIWEEFDRERKHFLATDDFPGEVWHFDLPGVGFLFDPSISGNPRDLSYTYTVHIEFEALGGKEEEYKPKVLHAQHYFRFLGPLIIDTAERTWRIRKPALEDIYIQPANVERIWLKLSPLGLYDAATQTWAGTDLLGTRDFFNAVRRYRQQVIDYFYDKDVFGSLQWFTAEKGTPDWSSFPQFSFQRVDVKTNAERALPDVGILLMLNVILFIVIFLVFIRSEI
ncbi:ABC transporter permease subunit [Candidatus Poribacteria bacterium]|nr:ABC transporter permease subunit [Candidatus Poribacteria bacterium]MXV84639.1 ABC transporter permease subunit [Candidatus Poribacteria bacterium]MYA58036.1 ABC transporter permease subunit [Candidatus Poribacteria bacterium]